MTRQQHSPRVRRLAGEHGVDLAGLRGSGPAGRVRPADVLAAAQPATRSASTAATAAVPSAAAVVVPAAGSGRTVAAAVVEAQLGVADDRPVGPLAAVALLRALRRTPLADADGRHLAVLVDGADGRRGVRVLRDAGDLNPAAVARHLADPDGLAEEASAAGDGPAPAVALCDSAAAGLLHEVPQLPAGLAAVVSVGVPVERPTVVRHDGQPMLAIGAVSTVGIVHDPARIAPAAAHALLGAVRAELETLRSTTNPTTNRNR
ncbi:E3 binding domain-containing protein [Solwaraspora sp. WMMD792]|uniref:E3 binding domain-containing protein n=1 Tax=Solwaraspora sp. WMMD792 TaxID=3016099 RepID=UPI002417AF6F|nr:E3 binding domain-containing protein [Solwaraspora sp. WMMD792]MDG4770218.1 E3 binding domain-containing protein [Solwaraspora sp. WMMD792]